MVGLMTRNVIGRYKKGSGWSKITKYLNGENVFWDCYRLKGKF